MTFNALPTARDVVDFWREAGPDRWFAKNDAFDAEFAARFSHAHQAAARGELDHWTSDAEGALALLVLFDQFPRNTWRGSPHMLATDGKALAVAKQAVESGFDLQCEPVLRRFFYLPFMHSEVLAEQERSVELNAALDANTQRYAVLHRDIIARFGRFPHRNRMMGRSTTAEEQKYLDEGGFAG
ncbi:Uncharacterized conserved protein, DUF924 family [Variovorax sp. YR634]|jgi:uncharacterized protein (DUF924 family)|uniref:DUF924 family protein n=1 Tax=Variovorax TaxID=34072 RepID=UPI00089621BA|nr:MULTISPECIES: DUF924 family protein [Variovorax]MDQ0081236.1 uncharacterized protein (DUF924 family) [Variovorax boronicumulans]SDX01143.1 Uncharacterized conserved protein, DUF924 family [Variovorax sp. YR634]SDZ46856.1 Uncharacterized conserved protein, DUF924 family [Variovorax sp. YR266]SOD28718.1 Uncharacterized conserved protein, DUF924 family [Variovorax sp. YR752]